MDNPIDAPQAAATATAPEATAPVVASEPAATEGNRKTGFLASLFGKDDAIRNLESQLASEQQAHAATLASLADAQGRIIEFEAMEARLEKEVAAAAQTAQQATAAATTAAENVPQQVAAQVRDVVAGLGVEEEKLVAVQTEPAAKGDEFSHLKGRDRTAAAFAAQFAK